MYGDHHRDVFRKSKNLGVSAVIARTAKGKQLFESIKDQFIVDEISYAEMTEKNPSMTASTPKNDKRTTFFENWNEVPVKENISRYTSMNTWKKKIIFWTDKVGLFKVFKWVQGKMY